MTLRWANPNRKRFKRSQTEERRVASLLDGRVLPRSGGGSTAPKSDTAVSQDGDFRTRLLHVEHKRSETPQITVEWKWLAKVTRGARACMKTPALALLFETLVGEARDWLFLPVDYFRRVSGSLKNPERFLGDLRETKSGSLILKAPAMAALMPPEGSDVVPTMILDWLRPEGSRIWVGTTLTHCRPWLVEEEHDASAA